MSPSITLGFDPDEDDEPLIGPGSAGVAAPSAPFAPTDIAGLKLWLNPDVGVFQTAGGAAAVLDAAPVGQWQDQSATGAHAAQLTAGSRPLLKLATQNGKNTVLWDGVNDSMATPSIAHGVGTGDFWWVVCAKTGVGGGWRQLVGNAGTAPGFYLDSFTLAVFWGATEYHWLTALGTNVFRIFELMRTGTSLKTFTDGVQDPLVLTAATNMASGGASIGSDLDGTWFNSNQGQTLMYAGNPTPTERANLINFLGTYYDIAVTP